MKDLVPMPIEFAIYPDRNVNILRHSGYCDSDQALRCLETYRAHPDYCEGHMQLIDCSGVTDFRRNPANFLAAQVRFADFFPPVSPDRLICFYDAGAAGRDLADLIRRPWECASYMVTRIAHSEHDALRILGQPEESFAAFRAAATRSKTENLTRR